MIQCPNCDQQNVAGSAFCAECGVSLLSSDPLTTLKMEDGPTGDGAKPVQPPIVEISTPGDHWLTLHIIESGQVLPLAARNEFTIGRIAEGQPVMPDIDLTPFRAYAHGVSRLHAVIKRGVDSISLMDLESANGTFVNGRRLDSNEECTLSNGDIIALGGLKMQILLKST